ncbi:MAG: hypothetical protein EOO32_05895 [Comamonadaceae bacterium]|nr:MAG: hypothetical protein EOO32_05895 [Comamonadaceae bacterium]
MQDLTDKREIAALLRKTADELESAADDADVLAFARQGSAPSFPKMVNVSSLSDWEAGDMDKSISGGNAPATQSLHIDIQRKAK